MDSDEIYYGVDLLKYMKKTQPALQPRKRRRHAHPLTDNQVNEQFAKILADQRSAQHKMMESHKMTTSELKEAITQLNAQLQMRNVEQQVGNEDLQRRKEELQKGNEDLQRRKEDLQKGNEELQRRKEELQRLNEELQRTNEELQRTNAELQRRNEELQTMNAALQLRNEEFEKFQLQHVEAEPPAAANLPDMPQQRQSPEFRDAPGAESEHTASANQDTPPQTQSPEYRDATGADDSVINEKNLVVEEQFDTPPGNLALTEAEAAQTMDGSDIIDLVSQDASQAIILSEVQQREEPSDGNDLVCQDAVQPLVELPAEDEKLKKCDGAQIRSGLKHSVKERPEERKQKDICIHEGCNAVQGGKAGAKAIPPFQSEETNSKEPLMWVDAFGYKYVSRADRDKFTRFWNSTEEMIYWQVEAAPFYNSAATVVRTDLTWCLGDELLSTTIIDAFTYITRENEENTHGGRKNCYIPMNFFVSCFLLH